MTRRRATFLRLRRGTTVEPLVPLSTHPAPSMTSLLVISLAITILALCSLFTTEVVLQHLDIPTLISGFVAANPANPAFVYNVVLIGIPIVFAIFGTVFLAVFSILGGRGDHDAEYGEYAAITAQAHARAHEQAYASAHAQAHLPSMGCVGCAMN